MAANLTRKISKQYFQTFFQKRKSLVNVRTQLGPEVLASVHSSKQTGHLITTLSIRKPSIRLSVKNAAPISQTSPPTQVPIHSVPYSQACQREKEPTEAQYLEDIFIVVDR